MQKMGQRGEDLVAKHVQCPRCGGKLRRLKANFQCIDVICEVCTYVAQVKAVNPRGAKLPRQLLGAAWGQQKKRMDLDIYPPLYIAVFHQNRLQKIYLVPSEIQKRYKDQIFIPRNPLKETARRAGWQGFYYKFNILPTNSVLLIWSNNNPISNSRE